MDGSIWRLISTPDTQRWLRKFAAITQANSFNWNSTNENRNDLVLEGGTYFQVIEYNSLFVLQPKTGSVALNPSKVFPLAAIWKKVEPNFDIIQIELGYGKDGLSAITPMVYSLHSIYVQTMARGGLPFHAGFIEKNGVGFLVAGSGGAGKSTFCRRVPSNWDAICDDETLVVRDDQGDYYCHPFPTWSEYFENRSEKTWDVQHAVPLRAIFYIEQSSFEIISPLEPSFAATLAFDSASQVLMRYWSHGTQEENRREKTLSFENACELAIKIPFYRLRTRLNGSVWEDIENILNG